MLVTRAPSSRSRITVTQNSRSSTPSAARIPTCIPSSCMAYLLGRGYADGRSRRVPPPPAPLAYHPGMPEPLALPGPTRAFIAAPGRFATLATLAPDGAPRQAVVWYRLDQDGMLVINSAEGRHWPANLRRDARVAIAIADPSDGYHWVGPVSYTHLRAHETRHDLV